MRDYHDCELCARRYEAGNRLGRPWDGALRCVCGGAHRVCGLCAARWDLTVAWPTNPLRQCPDEVRLALDLMGSP